MAGNDEQGPVGGVTPHLTITENRAAEAIDFYKAAFGAEERMRMPSDDGKRLIHVHLIVNGASLMMADDFPEYTGGPSAPPACVTLHLQVDDADQWFDRAVGAGASVRMPLGDQFWGDRAGMVTDPAGYNWWIATHKEDLSPEELNRRAEAHFAKMAQPSR